MVLRTERQCCELRESELNITKSIRSRTSKPLRGGLLIGLLLLNDFSITSVSQGSEAVVVVTVPLLKWRRFGIPSPVSRAVRVRTHNA